MTDQAQTATDNLPGVGDNPAANYPKGGVGNTVGGVTGGAAPGANAQSVVPDPPKKEGSLKISISLDLDVEVHLTARVKGDIVIGLL